MGIEGYYEDYFDERQEEEKLTNFQKIKNMTLDEMAEIIQLNVDYKCDFCKGYACDEVPEYSEKCNDGIKQWLQEESEG